MHIERTDSWLVCLFNNFDEKVFDTWHVSVFEKGVKIDKSIELSKHAYIC